MLIESINALFTPDNSLASARKEISFLYRLMVVRRAMSYDLQGYCENLEYELDVMVKVCIMSFSVHKTDICSTCGRKDA